MANNTVLPGTGETYAATELMSGGALAKHQHILIGLLDGPSLDATGRLRTSTPVSEFDSKLLHGDSQPLLWDEALESGTMATSGPTEAQPFIDFTSTNLTAGVRTRQTFQRFDYESGKSHLVMMTGVLELASGVKTGCERRVGTFDDNNGLFFESDAGIIGVTIRSNNSGSPVDTTIVQANWNLDKMSPAVDGTPEVDNPSGIALDITKEQLFVFDYLWLSSGRVRFGLHIKGVIYYVHEFNSSANVSQIPWTSTPNLPIRYQIITTVDSGICSMRCICAAVISEGGFNPSGIVRYKSTGGTHVTATTENVVYAVVGIRLKSTHIGASIDVKQVKIQIQNASKSIEWILIHNPAVAGTFTYSDLTNSAVQTALGASVNTVTGGTETSGGFSESGAGGGGKGSNEGIIISDLGLGTAIDGTRDTVVLCVRCNGGTSAADIEGSLHWREVV